MNQFISIFLLLLFLYINLVPVFTKSVLCVSESSNCSKYTECKDCHPLQWYMKNESFKSNSTFFFLPERHKLCNSMNIRNVSRLTLEGSKQSTKRSEIACCFNKTGGGVSFLDVTNVNLTNITFTKCGIDNNYTSDNFTVHATVSFRYSSNITLSGVVIDGSTGFGLHVDRVYGFIRVQDSVFKYSTNVSHNCSHNWTYKYTGNARFYYGNDSKKGSSLVIKNSSFLYGHGYRYNGRRPDSTGLLILIYAPAIQVTITNITAKWNTARTGGNIGFVITYFHENTSNISISGSVISHGESLKGAGLMSYIRLNNTHSNNCNTDNNTHNIVSVDNVRMASNTGGAVYIHQQQLKYIDCTLQRTTFTNCIFHNNTGYRGIAVAIIKFLVPGILPHNAVQFDVTFQNCTFSNNTLNAQQDLEWKMQLKESVMMLLQAESVTVIDCTFKYNNVTAISLVNSNLCFKGVILFKENKAINGGALNLCDSSIIYMKPPTHVQFVKNSASVSGGAIYVEQRRLDTDPPCFYQPLVSPTWDISEIKENFQFEYVDNRATIAGDALYGGAVSYCYMICVVDRYKNSSGVFDRHINSSLLFRDLHNISSQNGSSIVSSDPFDVIFCGINRTSSNKTVYIYPGERFSLLVSTVGQCNGHAPAFIDAAVLNPSPNVSLLQPDLPPSEGVQKICQDVSVTIFTNIPNVTLELTIKGIPTASTAALNLYRNKRTQVFVSLKECPWIFKSNKSNGCDCAPIIKNKASVVSCDINTCPSFNRGEPNVWVGCKPQHGMNDSSAAHSDAPCSEVVVTKDCPTELCADNVIRLTQLNATKQCHNGREGIMCGRCKDGYSLSLGQEGCVLNSECSHWKLFVLLLVFALAGLFLVSFMAVFNFTVSQGTMYGLLFYISVIHVNRKLIFIKDNSGPSFLGIFVAWLNLDLGFDVCLYSGIDAYQKIWLELSFVLYLLLLSLLIISLSHKFIFITRLVGRNVVSVLSTVLVLSYAKVARISIKSLKYVILYSSNGNELKVWYYDGTIQYFQGKHIPLAMVAITMLVIISIYVLALLFVQCLQRRSNWCILRWVNQLRPFFDAHAGPCRDHYRFWPGFLLFCLLALFSLRAFAHISDHTQLYLALGFCVFTFVLACISPHGVYKKWPLNLLEFSFFLNLGFVTALVPLKLKWDLASISVGIAAATFILIVAFHGYQRISATRRWQRLVGRIQRRRFKPYRYMNINAIPRDYSDGENREVNEHTPILSPLNNRLRESLLSDD